MTKIVRASKPGFVAGRTDGLVQLGQIVRLRPELVQNPEAVRAARLIADLQIGCATFEAGSWLIRLKFQGSKVFVMDENFHHSFENGKFSGELKSSQRYFGRRTQEASFGPWWRLTGSH